MNEYVYSRNYETSNSSVGDDGYRLGDSDGTRIHEESIADDDQKRVKASSYIEYAPSLLQNVDESQYSIHIDFELYDRLSGGPRVEYCDSMHYLPEWITYY